MFFLWYDDDNDCKIDVILFVNAYTFLKHLYEENLTVTRDAISQNNWLWSTQVEKSWKPLF